MSDNSKSRRAQSISSVYTLPTHEIEAIADHLERYYGKSLGVLHETVSEPIHIDLLVIPASKKIEYHVLSTIGASAYKMPVPEDLKDYAYAEYMVFLPKEVDIKKVVRGESDYNWVISMLKMVARLPSENKTWLGYGHTIANGDPPKPLSKDTEQNGILITYPYLGPQEAVNLKLDDKVIWFWSLVPLYQTEWEYKNKNGTEKLESKADEKKINIWVINPKRPKVV